MRINSSTAGRLGVALALAAGALGVTSAGAAAAPATTTAETGPFNAAGETITVRGSDFTAANGVTTGIYVAQAANVSGSLKISDTAQTWVRGGDINASGEFTTQLTVAGRFRSDSFTVDCFVEQCQIITWREHSPPLTLFSTADVDFYVPPTVNVSATTGLDRNGPTTVTVTGSRFDPANYANGFYLAYGPNPARFWAQDSSLYGAVKWLNTGFPDGAGRAPLNPDGTFSTTLTVNPVYTTRPRAPATPVEVDCRYEQCGIITFAAHGSAFRGYDTSTPVAFTPLPMTVSVTPTSELERDTPTTLTVKGTEFLTGAYVAQIAVVGGNVLYDQGKAKWLRRGGPTPDQQIGPKGAFETTLEFNPTFRAADGTIVDCRVTQCAVGTWRQHSNPTPAALFSTTPVAYKAAPVVREPEPVKRSTPSINVAKKPQAIAKNRTALIASLSCKGDAVCTLTGPKTVKIKLGKKAYRLTVVAPKSLAGGKSGRVYVKLPKPAVAALKGRAVKVKVKLTLKSTDKTAAKTATVTIKGKQVKKAAKKPGAAKKVAAKR